MCYKLLYVVEIFIVKILQYVFTVGESNTEKDCHSSATMEEAPLVSFEGGEQPQKLNIVTENESNSISETLMPSEYFLLSGCRGAHCWRCGQPISPFSETTQNGLTINFHCAIANIMTDYFRVHSHFCYYQS